MRITVILDFLRSLPTFAEEIGDDEEGRESINGIENTTPLSSSSEKSVYKFLLLFETLLTDGDIDEQEVWEDEGIDGDVDSSGFQESCESVVAMSQPNFNDELSDSPRAFSLLRWMLIFISFQAKYHISDYAIDVLFNFLYVFFLVLARFSPFVTVFTKYFPKSRHLARRFWTNSQVSIVCRLSEVFCPLLF